MPCYEPIRALLFKRPDGRGRIQFGGPPVGGKSISLPCGYCIGCRLERARQWAVRIVHESKMHSENSFITLTYDDDNLPSDGSLSVKHCQLFLKRLRERVKPARIKFFLCGEYGDKLGRPHYHAIVFGYSFPDKVYLKGSGELSLYSSRLLSESWGHGFASIGQVSFDSALYVANYATKKVRANRGAEAERLCGRRSEFLLMSRGGREKGGIGRSWIEKFASDVYPSDEVIIRGKSVRPTRYYDQWLKGCDPETAERIREKREAFAEVLEEMVLGGGEIVRVQPARNARRLKVREVVAKAKLALKRREMEK